MNEDKNNEERIEDLLKLARLSINFSLTLMFSAVLIIVLLSIPKNVEREVAIVTGVQEYKNEFEEYASEIEKGIHMPSGLIADTGFSLVYKTCGQCHSLDLVKQNKASAQGWKDMIKWMQETQGLWDLGEDEAKIIAFLAKNYAPTNSGRRKNLENIVWYNLED